MTQTLEKVKVSGGNPPLWKPHTYGSKRCPGCHYQTLERATCETLEELGLGGQAVIVTGVGCCARSYLVMDYDGIFAAHGRATDVATAIKRVRPELFVFTWQGDGDSIAIGTEGLINSAIRAEKITILMINNANYGTTGGQAAPTTLLGQTTTTTPGGRDNNTGYPAHVAELMAQFKGVAYSVRTSIHTPANFQKTKKYLKTAFEKQTKGIGLGFVEVLSACPSNWHLSPIDSLTFIEEKMIAEYPLGEFKNVDAIA